MPKAGFLPADIYDPNDTTDQLVLVDQALQYLISEKLFDVTYIGIDIDILSIPAHLFNSDRITVLSLNFLIAAFR